MHSKAAHPGVMLARHFMRENNLSINELARRIKVPPNRICAIVNGERSITIDTALRLSVFFDTTPEFWLHMQVRYDLAKFSDEDMLKIQEDIAPLEKVKKHFVK